MRWIDKQCYGWSLNTNILLFNLNKSIKHSSHTQCVLTFIDLDRGLSNRINDLKSLTSSLIICNVSVFNVYINMFSVIWTWREAWLAVAIQAYRRQQRLCIFRKITLRSIVRHGNVWHPYLGTNKLSFN